jgi:hypothetical protein
MVASFAIVPASRITEPSVSAAGTAELQGELRVAVVGDSLSAGRSKFLGNGLDDESWMSYTRGDGIDFVGGWARSGATPDEMASAIEPIDDVDVLVILAGTNAVRLGETVADEADAYRHMVDVVKPERVLVSSIPPYSAHAADARIYNSALRSLTEAEGWTWVDPWVAAVVGEDWIRGFSVDGIHPAGPAEYAVLGEAFRELILQDRNTATAAGS